MKSILKEIYEYKLNQTLLKKSKVSQGQLLKEISSVGKTRGFLRKINNNLKMIIIDNPDKFQLGEQIKDITNLHKFVQADFFGFGPAFRGIGCTTVLINSSNKIKRSTNMTSYLHRD